MGAKRFMSLIIFLLVTGVVCGVYGSETGKIDPTMPPTITLKKDVPLLIGVAPEPYRKGSYFVKYEEISGAPGVFPDKGGKFFTSWLIFDGEFQGEGEYRKLNIINPLHLVFRVWLYDVDVMEKTLYQWEVTTWGINFIKVTQDKWNIVKDSGNEFLVLTPSQTEKFIPLIKYLLEEFQRRLREDKDIKFFTDEYDGQKI